MHNVNITEFQHNIALIVSDALSDPWPSMFWKTVKRVGPDDIIKPIQVYDEVGETKFVYLRHYNDDENNHVYEVSLNRDLTEKEAEKIVIVWEQLFDDGYGDFVIETSTPYTGKENDDHLNNDLSQNTVSEEAKIHHNEWMKRKMDEGWRYGLYFSEEEKTHPMLLPWEQLSEKNKEFNSMLESLMTGK